MRAVVFQDGDWWVGQCLECDIASQAKTYDGIVEELRRILTAMLEISMVHDLVPFQNGPAPQCFFDMYEKNPSARLVLTIS